MNALELAVVNYMPPEHIPALRKAISLKAETDQRLDDGRLTTSRKLEALVLDAINNTRAKLEESVSTNRRNTIEQHLTQKWEFYGLERLPDGTVKLPNRKLIKRVLKSQGL
jgi:hypothetical protein